VYNRANWCPGAEVETYSKESPFSLSELSAHFAEWRYTMEDYTWNGEGTQPYYRVESQVIFYANKPEKVDASLEEIISPSKNQMYARLNPTCAAPRIVIKNNGSDILKTLTITYGIPGGETLVYQWKGNLGFGDKQTVDLPAMNEWYGSNYPRFEVTLSEPNGGKDAYEADNKAYSYITATQVLPYKIIIYLKTNNNPEQNAYTLTDAYGKEYANRKDFEPNTVYRDTITLPNGCYIFRLTDAGENGLNWWAAPDEGAGVVRILDGAGKIMKSFNADFGAEVLFNFKTGWAMSVAEADAPKEILTYPNPATGEVNIDLGSLAKERGLLQVFNSLGQAVASRDVNTASEPIVRLSVGYLKPGMYIARFTSGSGIYISQFIKK
jgi:hypothetical protein